MKKLILRAGVLFSFLFFAYALQAQSGGFMSVDSVEKQYIGWHNKDAKSDKIEGVSVEKAYNEFLKGKSPKKKIIVAVIDGGVDVYHPDLQPKIWVNKDEIPNNGIDDDNNGYIDDVNGWGFLGNAKGENVHYENMEITRLYRKFKPVFEGITSEAEVSDAQKADYKIYSACKADYDKELAEYQGLKGQIDYIKNMMTEVETSVKGFLHKETFTAADVKAIKTSDKELKKNIKLWLRLNKAGLTRSMLDSYTEEIDARLNYHLNMDLDARSVIGDNPEDINDSKYGNNIVKGPDASHGTFVAGIIGAVRNNGFGVDGIADNIEIMVLRIVPDGDERDKDVALAIRYAVDNGANVINMSFGKDYSPQKSFVDEAAKYAEAHNVLLVHAAGNDSKNVDVASNFPSDFMLDSTRVNNWITVGASAKDDDKHLCASFSNYGVKSVDVFAPGVNVVSTKPESKYDKGDGTSFASPVVAGVAALVWSYYPELSAVELKSILLNSAEKPSRKVYLPGEKKKKVKFSTLSTTGGIVNAYDALVMADEYVKNKK
jgi:subtilisin family serine protease